MPAVPPPGWPVSGPYPLVKVCGLSDPDLAAHAAAAGVDMVGVVHFQASPRHVGVKAAADVAKAVAGRALVVALTVDADDATLDALVSAARPDILQFHGRETPERVTACAQHYGLPVAKAFGIARADDLCALDRFPDALPVLDAKPPKGADRPGGHGQRFDWAVLGQLGSTAYMLSGGLTPATAGDATSRLQPYAIDVSSGVETGGQKDPAKIAAFIEAIHLSADAAVQATAN